MTDLALTVDGHGARRLLLLHPLGGDGHFFDPLVDLLVGEPAEESLDSSAEFSVLRCDLPGHGVSGPGTEDSIAAMAASLERSLRAAMPSVLSGPSIVVGVSLGGLVAQQLAAVAPDLVAGLVLVDCVATYPEPLREQWRRRAEDLSADRAVPLDYLEATRQVWFDDAAPQSAVDYVARTLEHSSASGYAQACRALETADTSELVCTLSMPAAVVCGRDDGPAFRDAVAWFLTQLPDAVAFWLDHKHATALQDPHAFREVLVSFLSTLPGSTFDTTSIIEGVHL